MTKDRGKHTAVKLLIVINQFYKGGAETNLLNLLKALPETDDQVDLLVYDQMKLPNVISLLPQVPPHVTVCDAAEREDGNGFWHKALCRITRDATKKQLYRPACFEFVKDKHYDAAISYGEWISPEFVAEHVQADRKIVWIHSDIDKALFFNEEVMFRFDDKIDLYLFASGKSMETALARYPIMQGRATVVHNLCDDEGIRRAAMEKAPETEKMKRPLLLTVANFRAEKNHLRQVEAMALLKKRGLDFTWLNIGSDTDTALISQIDAAVKKRGLEGRFIRMPAQASPYRFMKNADAVCVLSDFESWSLVISEAKLVGTPVIATRTSGAIEQIEDGETGVLCDFTPEAIADGIERLLKDAALQSRIRKALEGFSTQQRSVQEFTQMLTDCPVHRARPSLLYVSDNINYVSGVQRVTATQVQALRRDFAITVFSMEVPDERSRRLFAGVPIVDMQTCCGVTCLAIPCRDVLLHRGFTMRQKAVRLAYGVMRKLGKEAWVIEKLSNQKMKDFFEGFDTVCVLSEASQMRDFVSKLSHPKKIQWIHTDYALWSEYSDWTRQITANDGERYRHYDRVVCLTETSRQGFLQKHPELSEKTIVVANLQPVEEILKKAQAPLEGVSLDKNVTNIVSVGRMDTEKAVDRILRIARRLTDEGYAFHWYFVGDGVLLREWTALRDQLALQKTVTFLGRMENPYPVMKAADCFALLSKYEGLPVTIDEAKLLHVPVIATRVGGIPEQIQSEKTGILVDNDEQDIYNGLKRMLAHPECLNEWRENLRREGDRNAEILQSLMRVFAPKGA